MLPANGLYGHIRNNTLKSLALLAGFLLLLELFYFAQLLFQLGMGLELSQRWGDTITISRAWKHLSRAGEVFSSLWDQPIIYGLIWFAISYVFHARMIRSETGAKPVERRDEKRLYNIVEKLAITAGLPMPRVEIMETSTLNAYASGLGPNDSVIAVTRGLLDTLTEQELEAVIAHEMAHIKNRDVLFMMAATISVGILHRICRLCLKPIALAFLLLTGMSVIMSVNFLFLTAVGLLVAGGALLLKFGISRAREFLADAGAVELTKDPGALISALRRIADNDRIEGATLTTQAMMISNSLHGWFATHPSLEERIAALKQFAGTLLADDDAGVVVAHRSGMRPRPPALVKIQQAAGRPSFGRRNAGAAKPPRASRV